MVSVKRSISDGAMNTVRLLIFVFVATMFLGQLVQKNVAKSSSFLDVMRMMDDAKNDFHYPQGCANIRSLSFCRRMRRYGLCNPGKKNFKYMKQNCQFTCGVCY